MCCQNPTHLSVENWLFNANKVYSFPSLAYQPFAIRNSAIKKNPAFCTRYFRTNDTFSDQWVFGPMTLFRTNGFRTNDTLFWTNGSLDQWVFEPMGFRTNGPSDQWVFGPMGRQTNGLSDNIIIILTDYNYTVKNYNPLPNRIYQEVLISPLPPVQVNSIIFADEWLSN